MEKEEIIEKISLACKNNIGGIFDIIRENGFTITRNGNKNVPRMAVFYPPVCGMIIYNQLLLILDYLHIYHMK